MFLCASPAGAATYYVRQDGSDLCNGLTDAAATMGPPACAFRTVQKGVDAASTPGDRVVIHGGTYRESVSVRVSGAEGAVTTVEGYPGESAIIDPGETSFRAAGNGDWELVDAGLGEYRSTAEHPGSQVHAYIDGVAGYENGRVGLVTYLDARDEPGGSLPGFSMFRAPTDVYADGNTPFYVGPGVWLGKGCSGGSSPGSACEIDSDCPDLGICAPTNRIHIRLSKTADMRWAESRYGSVLIEEDADPRNYSIIVSLADMTLRVQGSYLMFRNLTFNPSHRTVRLESGAHHVTFDGVTIWAGSRSVSASAAVDPPHDVLITRSRIFGDNPYWIFWSDAKDPPYPAIGKKGTLIDLEQGAHDVEISYCHIRGGFDGIGTNTSEYNVAVHHSRIENFLDDAFEVEGLTAIGRFSAYENYIANSLVAFAPGQDSPVVTGPILFYRNVVSLLREPPVNRAPGINNFNGGFRYGSEYAFKQHAPNTFYYNNTVALLNSGHDGVSLVPGDPNEQADTYVANNIYVKVNGQVQGAYLTGPGQIVDHNLYWKLNSGDGKPLAGGSDTIAVLTAATGLEVHGIGATPRAGTDPEFATWGLTFDTSVATRWSLGPDQEVWSTSDFLLSGASPAIGAGMALPVHPAFGPLPDSRPSQDDLGAIPFTASSSEWEIFPFDQGWRGPVTAPDLVVLQLTDPPPALLGGETLPVVDVVSERGPVAADPTITGYYLSADRLRGGPDILLGTRTVPGLAVGETSSATSSFNAPPSPGSYYLLACVDDTGLIAEGSETNNCRASAGQVRLTAPDLVETAVLDPPATVAAGASLSVTDSALNQGDAAAGASTTRYYVSLDTLKDGADVLLLGGRTLPSLPPSGVSTGTVSVTVPAATPTGFYHLLACADATGQIVEISEPNNCRASAGLLRVTVPDLMETALSDPPASAQAGGSFSASDTVANQGLASSSSSMTRYFLSTDTVKDESDVSLSGGRSISSLAAGVSSSGSATVTIPSTAPGGSFRLLACADGNQVVFESNETNNCRASAGLVQVQVRDLVETSVTDPPASASPGSNFSVTDTTMNQGAVSAGGSTTRYYLSVDALKDVSDVKLSAPRSVSSLAPLASSTGTVTAAIPSNAPEGSYLLLACADDTSSVTEGNEMNNCRPSLGRVLVTVPDLQAAPPLHGVSANYPPSVSAGPDRSVTLPAAAALDGTVSDDGQPAPPALTTLWSVDSGPGTVLIAAATAVDTTATFSAPGTYVLRLTANDGQLTVSDTVTVTVAGAPITLERRVSAGSDDAEESASLGMSLTSSDLELVNDGNNQQVGMRFTGVAVPKGAVILSAYIQFKVDEADSTAASLLIQGQNADSAPTFTSSAGNISSRPKTVAAVPWTPAAWTVVGQAGTGQRTPDLSAVIQEIVNRQGWASGNSVVLIVTGTGRRTADAFEDDPQGAPLLHLEVVPINAPPSVSAGPDRSVTLPAAAALDGTVSDDGQPAPPALTTLWSVDSGPGTVQFAASTAVDTTATFSVPGTYVLRLTANDGQLSAADTVTVTVAGAPTILDRRVSAGSDDAEESASLGMSLTSSDLELVNDGNDQQVGMRFTGVAVPKGAVILSAYIQFKVDEADSTAASLLIRGQSADSAPTFTSSAGNISSRPKTVAAVPWTPAAWTVVGQAGTGQRTPDLSAVIQEIVNRQGWASGNSVVLIVTGTGRRTADAFEDDPQGAPLLHVEYR